MELHEALEQISHIRSQVDRVGFFRGYRPLTVAATGGVAVLAAVAQPFLAPRADFYPNRWLVIWLSAAALNLTLVAADLAWVYLRTESPDRRRKVQLAIELFGVPLIVGALLTAVLWNTDQKVRWVLPGLWQIFFGLGVFASARLMPPAVLLVGCFYTISGLVCLRVFPDNRAFSPWVMGLPFAIGQFFSAACLYWYVERGYGPQED